jgi:methionyl-tRNA formyltransferase
MPMKVLLLSPHAEKLAGIFAAAGDETVASTERLTGTPDDVHFVVSYGYRHILKEPLLSRFAARIINVHISMLPWNRGADPNFWSWFERTPKGVTIHRIDAGLDTGDVLIQRPVKFGDGETLKTSYERLHDAAVDLLTESWSQIRSGRMAAKSQTGSGSYHRSKDKERWWSLLPAGYDTPVAAVERLGREHAATALTEK